MGNNLETRLKNLKVGGTLRLKEEERVHALQIAKTLRNSGIVSYILSTRKNRKSSGFTAMALPAD